MAIYFSDGARETKVTTPWEIHIVTREEIPPQKGITVHHDIKNNSQELVDLYQQSHLFVLPTRADCYSAVAMEAQASGLPVIISRIGGIPEIIQHEITGYLTDLDDFDTIAMYLDRLVENTDLREKMGHAARIHAEQKLNCRVNMQFILDAMKAASRRH